MKAFIAVNKNSRDAQLDERFGRAPYFIIVDTDSGEIIKTIENANINDDHGVGIKVANIAINEDVECVIGRHFGPKVSDALKAAQINILESEVKDVEAIIDDFRNNRLNSR